MTDSFIHSRADYKLWAENMKGRYEDQGMVSALDAVTIQTTMKKTKRDFRKLFLNL